MSKTQTEIEIEAQLYFISLKRSELCVSLSERPITQTKVIGFYTKLEQMSFIDSKIITVPKDIELRLFSEELKTLRALISLEKGVKILYRKDAKEKRDEKVILE